MNTPVSEPVRYYIQICQRCEQEADSLRSSWFNTHMLCPDCRQTEAAHPLYEHAQRQAFVQAQTGNYRFTGIGLPEDLQEKYRTKQAGAASLN